jgi:hypothetical protein
MATLLQVTTPGAAFDSSVHDLSLRCHSGTRLVIVELCPPFIINCSDKTKTCSVVDAARVGKSAIMQSITIYPLSSVSLRALILFPVNGRSDGSKTIIWMLAYQLAAQRQSYHQSIKPETARDLSLLY